MKVTRLRIGSRTTNALPSDEHDRQLGCDVAPPATPDDERNYWAEVIEGGDKFYYRVDDTTIEITAKQFRRVIRNPMLHYFSTALRLHFEIKREKQLASSSP